MNVEDINDNAPVFDPSSYSNEVWENATRGTSILMVSATDIDDGAYPYLISSRTEKNKSMETRRSKTRGFLLLSNSRLKIYTHLYISSKLNSNQYVTLRSLFCRIIMFTLILSAV